nr:MAG TPA: hypothetical protein [Caudoviricetes sp.]
MGKLNELKRMAREELENFADRGLSTQTVETAKNLASLVCKLDCIEQGEYNQYSRRDYPDYRYNDGMGGIGMPAYSQRRDSMGRYARDGDYSYHSGELERAIDGSGLNEETKRELKRLLNKMGG